MRKFYTLITIVAATFAAQAQTPLNVNGSLEDWADATTQPEGWFISNTNLTNGVAVKATGGAQDGDNFVRLQNRTQASGNNNLGLQDVAVTPGETYTVSYWYKSDSETFNFKHWIQWRTELGGGDNITENITTFQPENSNAPSVGEWTNIIVTETAPMSANAMRVNFRNYTGSSFASIDNVIVYQGLASVKENNIEGLNIYPNPATNIVNVTSANPFAEKHVQLFDMVGKKVIDVKTTSTINIETLNKGIYVIKINEEGKTATRKLVVK